MIWQFLFSNFQIVLAGGSGWKEGKEEQTSQRWRIVSPATAGEKKCLLLPDAAQMLRCTRKSRGWFNWSQIVKICKNENFGFGIGPCVKPSSRNCTTEWLAPIVQPFPTTRTFSSTTIQQQEPFWAQYNTKNLFQPDNTTTSIIGRQVKSLWIGIKIFWVHFVLNMLI